MGKYKNSDIHQKYSDWHWSLININTKYRRLYVADIDRLWVEYDFNKNAIVAIMDLKYQNNGDINDMGMTSTEKGIYEHFESLNIPVYIVFITYDFRKFTVYRFAENNGKEFSSIEYADWMLSLRSTRIKSY